MKIYFVLKINLVVIFQQPIMQHGYSVIKLFQQNMLIESVQNYCIYNFKYSNRRMNFLTILFQSSKKKEVQRDPSCLGLFCFPKENKFKLKGQTKSIKQTNVPISRSCSNSSKPKSSFNCLEIKSIKTKFITHKPYNKQKQVFQKDELIGLMNIQGSIGLLLSNLLCIRIGKYQQIIDLRSLRANCLDKVVVMAKEWGEGFDIAQLVNCKQPVTFCSNSPPRLQDFFNDWQNQLVTSLGEYCLKQSINKIYYNIIIWRQLYWITFLDGHSYQSDLIHLFSHIAQIDISQSTLLHLIQKVTLKDYIQFINQPTLQSTRKIKHYLVEIDSQNQKKNIVEQKIQYATIKVEDVRSQKKYSIDHELKGSDNELQMQYFLKQINNVQMKKTKSIKQGDQTIQIYYFNQRDESTSSKNQNQNNLRKSMRQRKIRSSSADISYLKENFLDDELFDKY